MNDDRRQPRRADLSWHTSGFGLSFVSARADVGCPARPEFVGAIGNDRFTITVSRSAHRIVPRLVDIDGSHVSEWADRAHRRAVTAATSR